MKKNGCLLHILIIFLYIMVFLSAYGVKAVQAAQDTSQKEVSDETHTEAQSVTQRIIKVGYFESEGYQEMDEEGTMSGYGFDFLQMMLRYNDWQYTYVGYEKNWGDMIDMLRSGEIDMLTLADKTVEREAEFAYSEAPIGTSSTILTVQADNTQIVVDDYATYEGARIGLVEGSSHNQALVDYAAEKGFSYTPVYYQDITELLSDLRAGVNIDIALTSNMRQVDGERILDEFNVRDYYVIVKKENEELLSQINSAITQLNIYSPNWKSTLFKKYYASINASAISYSPEERAYLNQLRTQGTVIRAAINPELKPYAYFEQGEAKGIAVTIFREIADRLGISYEILESKDRWEYKEQISSGEADIDLTAYLDYSLAQRYNLKETDAYITSTLALLTSKKSNTRKDQMVVAVVRDPTEYIGYNNSLVSQYKQKEYESIQACIDAVKSGEVDGTFRYIYIAEQAVVQDYTNQLQYSVLSDCTFGLCIGVNNTENHCLLSILNKGVNTLDTDYTQGVMLEESKNVDQNDSLLAAAYDHPFLFIGVIILLLVLVFLMILQLVRNINQKNHLAMSKEMTRFIGYVTECYDLVVEVDLKAGQRTVYRMKNHVLLEDKHPHTPWDRAFFESVVPKESVDMMTEAFAEETIEKMILEGGQERYLECQVKNQAGVYNWYSYIIKAVPHDAQHPKNIVVFKKDIQDSKMDEEMQKQILRDALNSAKSASAAKGQFLSRMSHEIRTPLNAVIGYMEIAKDSEGNPGKMMHCVENSDSAAKHLLSIINDVLDISSIENGKMKLAHEEFHLAEQIKSISSIFYHQAQEKHVNFEVETHEVTQEWVIGDSLRLNQVLMNLLSNAVKFTAESGTVSLEITQARQDQKKVYMTFRVRDTGIGMSEEYQKRLFQPFEQESADTAQKYGGTGLGLSITLNLVQMMGGSIDVESHQGVGTVFTVSLTFEISEKQHEQSQTVQDYSHIRALIVDDDASVCEYMKSLLRRCKVKCTVVKSGEEALRQIKRRAGSDYHYDLCIMDWNMPEMNGIETARRIRKECDPTLPVIIATAYDVTDIEDEAKEAGVKKVIAKPLFQSTMFDLLVSLYGKYEAVDTKEKNLEQIQGMRALLAEDNPMNLEIATEILKKAGLVVEAVTDGLQAVLAFTEKPEGTYDVILMDIQMPVMDGYQATGAIRRSAHPEAKTIPIIAMTANAFTEDVNAALASGMNGHIAKPVNYDKLYEVLGACARKKTKERTEEKSTT